MGATTQEDKWEPQFQGEDGQPVEGNPVEAIFQAVGSASMCWPDMKESGVFDEQKAIRIAEGLIDYLREHPLPALEEGA